MFEFWNKSDPFKFFVAFAIVLALIGLTAWLVRRFGANRLGGNTRGRQPRLAVIDAATVDGRRRLVLIRRDNVEHLMMIGGPNDLVVEPNIVRATAGRDTGRDLSRDGYRSAPPEARQDSRQEMRAAPADSNDGASYGATNGNWPLQPSIEPPLPVPPQSAPPQPRVMRDYRASAADEPWVPPEVQTREPVREPAPRSRDSSTGSIAGMAAEFNAKLNSDFDAPPPPRQSTQHVAQPAPMPPPAPMREPVAAVPPPPAPPLPAQTDRNLAEMAQRLEAALRRPNTKDDIHPPVTDPLAAPVKPAEQSSSSSWRTEPKLDFAPEVKAEPKFDMTPETKIDMKSDTTPDAKAKNPFDSLEEEMASLLGRQPGKT